MLGFCQSFFENNQIPLFCEQVCKESGSRATAIIKTLCPASKLGSLANEPSHIFHALTLDPHKQLPPLAPIGLPIFYCEAYESERWTKLDGIREPLVI